MTLVDAIIAACANVHRNPDVADRLKMADFTTARRLTKSGPTIRFARNTGLQTIDHRAPAILLIDQERRSQRRDGAVIACIRYRSDAEAGLRAGDRHA
jgi:hypothetical protein